MMNWINVEDAMPEIETPVLVTFENRSGERIAQAVAFVDEYDTWRWWRFEDEDYTKNPKVSEWIDIIAWMPLPEPYNAEPLQNRAEVAKRVLYGMMGSFIPNGESGHDSRIRNNIKELGEIVLELASMLCHISDNYKQDYLASKRGCGEMAEDYRRELWETITNEEDLS